jgi:hypothetical protein
MAFKSHDVGIELVESNLPFSVASLGTFAGQIDVIPQIGEKLSRRSQPAAIAIQLSAGRGDVLLDRVSSPADGEFSARLSR